MIDMRAHNTQTPAQPGVAAARAAVRIRTAPISAVAAFCNSVLTTTDAGSPTPHRRPPIE